MGWASPTTATEGTLRASTRRIHHGATGHLRELLVTIPVDLVAIAESGTLEDAAIALAEGEQAGVDRAAIRAALDDLAEPVRIPRDADLFQSVARLAHHLFHEVRIRGDDDDYDAPENSFIDQVIERRRGLPILLSIVTIAVGERVGLTFDPIGFPGHFLIAPQGAHPRFFLDPFHGGDVVPEMHLRARFAKIAGPVVDDGAFEAAVTPPSVRAVIVRMCTNLALSYVRRDDRAGAARMRDHLGALRPDDTRVLQILDRFLLTRP